MYFHNNILCLKCCNACWYDVYLNRFTQPDSIIPSPGNSQDWDRYSYARNNPVKYIDPSGHYICEDIECRGTPKNYGERKEKNQNSNGSNLLNDIWDSYSQGWSNFNSAWSTIVAPDTPVIAEVYSVTYVIGWGGAHAGLILGAGGLACSAAGPSCVTAVEGFLGISGAANADGDPTNEIQAVGKIIEVSQGKIDYLLSNPSKAGGFSQLGYTAETLKVELVNIGRIVRPSDLSHISNWGPRFEKAVEIVGPSGLAARLNTVWQVDFGSSVTRLITTIPEVFR